MERCYKGRELDYSPASKDSRIEVESFTNEESPCRDPSPVEDSPYMSSERGAARLYPFLVTQLDCLHLCSQC